VGIFGFFLDPLKANGKITGAPICFADPVAIMAGMGGPFTPPVGNQGFFFSYCNNN
jgi:hypothetical protein